MKLFTKITAALLCVIMLLPMTVFGYPGGTEENPPVDMPKASPVIDGNIAADGACWSDAAYVNAATCGHFWGGNPLTSSAEIYFAYNDNGLYFAADIVDNDESNGFVVSTGYDNIDDDYGFNGDVMTLMLDPLGVFERSSYQTTPWYNIGIFSDNTVKVFRSQVNDADITASVSTAGSITENGWMFEVFIPWSIITADVSTTSNSSLSATAAKLSAVDSVSRASCMYMDRFYTNGTNADTWGRFITVCDTTYDGYKGTVTNGYSAKSFGLTLNNTELHEHKWSDWSVSTKATCTEKGVDERYCSECKVTETKVTELAPHTEVSVPYSAPTCTEDGCIAHVYCSECGKWWPADGDASADSKVIPAIGHSFSEWQTAIKVSNEKHGIDERYCANCSAVDQKLIAANNAPAYTVENFLVKIENADQLDHIRYAEGVHTTSNSIRNASTRKDINSKHIAENTNDNVFVRNMPTGGLYTFWIRLTDGTTYFVPVDMTYMEQAVTADGPVINVANLYGVSEYYIAKGEYSSADDVVSNAVEHVGSSKIGTKHSLTYTADGAGIYSVCFKYADENRADSVITVNVDVNEPEFTQSGLKVTVGNLENVKVMRAVYGDYDTSYDIKRAPGCRNFTAATIKGADEYCITFPENGKVSIVVQYSDGYTKVAHFDLERRTPTFKENGLSVIFGNLDDLYVIRYAEGEYSTSAEIKRAPGSKYIKPRDIVDSQIVVDTLEEGVTYTFCVQYNDLSCYYYTITASSSLIKDGEIIDVGSDRQLLLESFVINEEETTASLVLNAPAKKENVFTFNKSYESQDAVYHNIVKMPDGTYRMYYKATSDIRRICYIESKDGLTWTRPNLTTNRYNGSASNIVTNDSLRPDNLFVFYDTKPGIPENQRLKGVYGQWAYGLFFEYSTNGDGTDFQFWPNETTLMTTPTATQGAFFDTLNTIYWDNAKGTYVAFVRGFHEGDNYNLSSYYVQNNASKITRDIRVSYSKDGTNWTIPVPIVYDSGEDWQMYANAIAPYYRASQIYIGLPTRYQYPKGSSLPKTDIFLMSSRDFLNWSRTEEPYMTPNQVEGATWDYGNSGYPCVGFIETGDKTMSTYMKEKNSSGTPVLYRYELRIDGFRMAHGDAEGKELNTKFMTFKGDELEVNFKTAASGKMRVTLVNEYGITIQSDWMTGDDIGAKVSFDGDLSAFEGQNVFLKFELYDADLYSFKFN
ncbi:MAG: hypothetical protein IJC50_05100 [Clostridia bacterium]|nr:hypothetical protein [Clostridia bacterium]